MAAALLAANSLVSALPTDKAYSLQIKLVNGANKTQWVVAHVVNPGIPPRRSPPRWPSSTSGANEKLSLEEQDHSQVQGAFGAK